MPATAGMSGNPWKQGCGRQPANASALQALVIQAVKSRLSGSLLAICHQESPTHAKAGTDHSALEMRLPIIFSLEIHKRLSPIVLGFGEIFQR